MADLEERRATMTEAEEETKPRTTRPALDVLDHDQDRLLYHGDPARNPSIQPLSDGFDDAFQALSWYQAAGVRTLGHVEKVIEPAAMLPMSGLLEKLLTVNEDRQSAYVRRRLVEQLDDACDLAYRQFRERAGERVENGRRRHVEERRPRRGVEPADAPGVQATRPGTGRGAARLVERVRGSGVARPVGAEPVGADERREAAGAPRRIVGNPPLLERCSSSATRRRRRRGTGSRSRS